MKDALSEALMRRKKSGFDKYKDEEENKQMDLAPEVKDAGHAKLEVDISVKPQSMAKSMPPEMGDAGTGLPHQEPDDMSEFVSPEEARGFNDGQKPKSLLQRAQMAFLKKK